MDEETVSDAEIGGFSGNMATELEEKVVFDAEIA